MGEGLIKCLDDAGKTQANIVYINGDPTDNNAALFKQGYDEALKPKVDSGDYKIVGDQTGKWDATVAQTTFEQLFTQNDGKVDGVVSANDTMAGGIVTVLKNNKPRRQGPGHRSGRLRRGPAARHRRHPVRHRLQGRQPRGRRRREARDRDRQGRRLGRRAGQRRGRRHGGEQEGRSRSFATPVWITQENIKEPFDAGYTTVEKVCTPDFADACAEARPAVADAARGSGPAGPDPRARPAAP